MSLRDGTHVATPVKFGAFFVKLASLPMPGAPCLFRVQTYRDRVCRCPLIGEGGDHAEERCGIVRTSQ